MSEGMSPGSALLPYPKVSARGRGDGPGVREWTATEKVHGAHFALVCDRSGIRPAKRRELLDAEALDAFFGVSRIWPSLAVAGTRCAATVREAWGGTDAVVTLYGELAGGRYPHPEVEEVAGAQAVQTGVWYAPDLFWVLFDVMVETGTRRRWIGDREMRAAADTAGLACVPLLGHGTLERLSGLPSAFPTGIPGMFGWPELDGNLAEGFVLKPMGPWDEEGPDQDGPGGPAPGTRPVIKVKQKAFAEDERYTGARPYLVPPEGAAGVPAWLVAQAAALLTPARAAAAVSKLGLAMPEEEVAGEIAQDVAEEVATEVGGLEDAALRELTRALMPGARRLAEFDAEDRRSAGSSGGEPAGRRGGQGQERAANFRADR